MIFSELYSAYYNTVAKIMEAAFNPEATEKDLQRCVMEEAFSESVLTILPALKSGKWPLLHEDLSPVLLHKPTMPLTNLEKRWLKAIAEDPRVKLFDVAFPELNDVEPLFTRDDYKIYDQYSDGDPFEDEAYRKHFRLMLSAIQGDRPVQMTMVNRHGKEVRVRFYPKGFEYSVKDDKIRIVATGCKFKQFNLGRVVSCDFYNGNGPWNEKPIPEFGRYDDLVSLIGTACEKDALRTIRKQLEADLASDAEVSLLAKWLPSVNASNAETVRKAKRIARYLGMSDAEYRKTLVELRKKIRIIENHLREKDYSFDYAKQPSKAMFKYRKAFLRNDGERYHAFLEAVSSGEKQLHADNLAPYEIVRSALNANRWGFHADLTVGEKAALNASWASLPDFCDNRNALAVVDTSGSMYCYDNALPAAVALSLGLYFGERNTGIFHNHFIEFSSRPQLIEIKGKTFAERLEYLCTFNEVADTNVEAVFDLILDAAVRNNVPQEELPETLYLISDMEFNACVRNASVSNFASAKRRFAEHGYRLPQIVFWNVASRNSNQPVTKNEQGVALVSGCTPRLFSMVASGDLSPYSVMMEIIESERYAKISA